MSQIKNDNILTRAPYDIDERKGFSLNGTWYLFNSPVQALTNPDVINYRHIGMTIPIYDGDNQADYWFYGGIEDEDFVIKSSSGGVVTTDGEIASGDPPLVIDWENDLVPGETITWLEKHGLLKDVVIQTEVPDPLNAGYFTQSLDSKKNSDYTGLILDNGSGDMRWLVLSKGTSIVPPPTPGFWDDNGNWNDSDNWED